MEHGIYPVALSCGTMPVRYLLIAELGPRWVAVSAATGFEVCDELSYRFPRDQHLV